MKKIYSAPLSFRDGRIDAFVYDTESLLYFKRAYHLNAFDLVGKPFSHVSYGIAVSHNLKKEGKELRDCISGILSRESFVHENHLRMKLWTIEVPGRDMTGPLVSGNGDFTLLAMHLSHRDPILEATQLTIILFSDG